MTTLNVSETTLEILRDRYQRALEELLDDTGEVTGGTHDDFTGLAEYHHNMVLCGKEIGTPFWEVARSDEHIAKYIPGYLEILKQENIDPEL